MFSIPVLVIIVVLVIVVVLVVVVVLVQGPHSFSFFELKTFLKTFFTTLRDLF